MAKLFSLRLHLSLSRSLLHTSCARLAKDSHLPQSPPPHDDMDFGKAVKILFSAPPREKKFGVDFHLWQLFVACLPPFAVYLTAQYARSEMRRLEKEKLMSEEEAKQQTGKVQDTLDTSQELTNASHQGVDSSSRSPSSPSSGKQGDGTQTREHPVVVNADEFQTIRARLEAMEKKVDELALTTTKDKAIANAPAVDSGSEKAKERDKYMDPTRVEDEVTGSQKHKGGGTAEESSMQIKQSGSFREQSKVAE